MAQLVIKWSRKALKKLDNKSLWYLANCGEAFVKSFAKDVNETVAVISCSPGIGRMKKESKTFTYRLYANHPRCSIYYKYDEHSVCIIDLIFTDMAYRP